MITLQDLHSVAGFQQLFADARFIRAIAYLREQNPPADLQNDAAGWKGWKAALDSLETLRFPPLQAPKKEERRPAYSPPVKPENKS
jgi:hypothetical protein